MNSFVTVSTMTSPPSSPIDTNPHFQNEGDFQPPSKTNPPKSSENFQSLFHSDEENDQNALARLQGTDHRSIYVLSNKSIIGRDPQQSDITISSKSVSSKHAVLEFEIQSKKWYLTDLNSLNGTFVNHHRLSNERLLLKHGDSIRFGYDQISYVLYILTDREAKRPFEKPILNQKTTVTNEQVVKLQDERRNLKDSIDDLRKKKKETPEIGTITFPGADQMITVPIGEWQEENRDDFSVHDSQDFEDKQRQARELEERERALREEQARREALERMVKENQDLLENHQSKNSIHNEDTILNHSEIENLSLRVSKLEENTQTKSSDMQPFLEQILQQIVQIENVLTAKDQNPNNQIELIEEEKDLSKMQQLIMQHLETIKDSATNNMKQLEIASKNISDQAAGMKRYATAVYNELQQTKTKLHDAQMEIYHLGDRHKRATVDLLTQQLEMKNAEISHLRNQLIQKATKGFSDPESKQKMLDICNSQFEELELARKEIYEWRQRHRLRGLEWEASLEERSRLEARVRELQYALHRQLSEVHVLMLHKEQHIQSYKSKFAELSSGLNTQVGVSEQQINRKKAAEFLFDEITRCERENSNLQVKQKHLLQELYQEQLKSNELKLEINSLKDVLQYTDAHNVQERLRALQDKLHDFQSECSVEKVIELKEDVVLLRQRLNESEARCKKLHSLLAKVTVPIDDSCISYLERKIKNLESTLKNTKSDNILGKQINRAKKQVLQKQNKRLNEIFYENSNAIDSRSVSRNDFQPSNHLSETGVTKGIKSITPIHSSPFQSVPSNRDAFSRAESPTPSNRGQNYENNHTSLLGEDENQSKDDASDVSIEQEENDASIIDHEENKSENLNNEDQEEEYNEEIGEDKESIGEMSDEEEGEA